MLKTLLTSSGLIIVIGLAMASAYWLGRNTGGPTTSAATLTAPPQSSEVLQEQGTAQLVDAISAIQRRLDALESAPTHERMQVPSARPPLAREEMEKREATRVQSIEETVQNEARDSSWAPAFERQIEQAVVVSAGDAGAALKSLSCRTSICRMEVSHTDQGNQRAFQQRVQINLPAVTVARYQSIHNSDGTFTTLIHLVRAGYAIPGADESQFAR